jgi:TolB-like protein
MLFRFDHFELDPQAFELRKDGVTLAVEPQVLSLLLLLVENRHRLVTRDEIVETVWHGRFISEAAVASRIKSARQALDDDGRGQRLIRTVHGKGFRFVGDAQEAPAPRPAAAAATGSAPADPPDKPSIAVLPFRLVGVAGPHALIAEALPHELIAELARLRWLFVIARGSSFRFRAADPDIRDVGAVLGVRYCLSGVLEVTGDRLAITVELADTRDGGVIWSERYAAHASGVHEIRARIVASIIVALEIQIPLHEARAARLKTPERLDAWAAYHLGLQHMFRFNKTDNDTALAMFERAIAQEPDFARAYAGLSFTHFQNAFLNYTPDTGTEAGAARRFAERGVELDPLDPFVSMTMGRSLWLEGDLESSLGWLDRSVTLSPNYAQAIYARAWAETLLCHGHAGQRHVDQAMALSPIDPLHYAMLATRALSHLVRGEDAEAAGWADRAARAPGAHVLICAIAAACHVLAGDDAKARSWAGAVRSRDAALTQAQFFRSFPFGESGPRQRISAALTRLDI